MLGTFIVVSITHLSRYLRGKCFGLESGLAELKNCMHSNIRQFIRHAKTQNLVKIKQGEKKNADGLKH